MIDEPGSRADNLADIDVRFTVDKTVLEDMTVKEVVLAESLLTPGLQTMIKIHSHVHNLPKKNLDLWKNSIASFKINRPILAQYKLPTTMEFEQLIYRMANRRLINNNNEEYTLYACDDTLLNNVRTLISNKWNCQTPSDVVREVLFNCAGVQRTRMDIEDSYPQRDYIAENIRPFEVVKQQADVALATGDDPSFLHFMTYENKGTHHFKSLRTMCSQKPIIELSYSESGNAAKLDKDNKVVQGGYTNPQSILSYSFPCDFDLLSDLMNGVESDGSLITSLVTINPFLGQSNLFGIKSIECGIGEGVYKVGMTNYNSAEQQGSCNFGIEQYLLKRQARMIMLDEDKVALRMTVPWAPIYNVGKVVRVNIYNKLDDKIQLYGSGDYLISSLVHTLKRGGYSTITMDCVSTTTGTENTV